MLQARLLTRRVCALPACTSQGASANTRPAARLAPRLACGQGRDPSEGKPAACNCQAFAPPPPQSRTASTMAQRIDLDDVVCDGEFFPTFAGSRVWQPSCAGARWATCAPPRTRPLWPFGEAAARAIKLTSARRQTSSFSSHLKLTRAHGRATFALDAARQSGTPGVQFKAACTLLPHALHRPQPPRVLDCELCIHVLRRALPAGKGCASARG